MNSEIRYLLLALTMVAIGLPNVTVAQSYGQITIQHPEEERYLRIGETIYKLTGSEVIDFPAGRHQVLIFSRNYEDALLTIHVQEGELLEIRVQPSPIQSERSRAQNSFWPVYQAGANVLLESDEDATICLDDACFDANTALTLPRGRYIATSVGPHGRRNQKRLLISETRLTHVDLSHRKTQEQLHRSAWVPGLSQYHRGEVVKSTLLGGAIATGLVLAVNEIFTHRAYLADYRAFEFSYSDVIAPEDVIVWSNRLMDKQHQVNQSARRFGYIMAATGLVYAINVIDGRRAGSLGYRTAPVHFQPFVDAGHGRGDFYSGIRLHVQLP